MKKLQFIIVTLLIIQFGYSQVGINTTTPNAQLDIKSSNQATPNNKDGILIPKIDAFPITNPTAAQQSMMVYLTTLSAGKPPGFYYWDNTGTPQWKGIGGTKGWDIIGNSGTNAAINFLGTIDSIDVVFRRNNTVSGKIGGTSTSLGFESLPALSTGNSNTAIGSQSMNSNTIGFENVAIGKEALFVNSSGSLNTAAGFRALGNSNASNNTAIGGNALVSNFTGESNVAVGVESLYSNFDGINNTALGRDSLHQNSDGQNNTGVGVDALYSNKSGSNATAIGSGAMQNANNTTTAFINQNVAVGFEALRGSVNPANNTGVLNTAIGYQSLVSNSTGFGNSAVGDRSLYSNTTGSFNSSYGILSLYSNTTGSQNNANGSEVLLLNTIGNNNSGFGYRALNANSVGSNNSAFGNASMLGNRSGSKNTAVGYRTLGQQTFLNGGVAFDANNVAIGYDALYLNNPTTTANGINNTAVGTFALSTNTTGFSNVAIGYQSLNSNSTGNANIAIGNQAGFSETGSNKLYIENSNSTTPLIYGEFDNNLLKIHGNIKVDNIATVGNEMQLVNKNNFAHGVGNQIFGNGGDDFLLSSEESANETAGVYGDGNAITIWSAGDANGGQSPALVYFLDEDAFDASNTNPYDASTVFPNPVALKSYITPVGAYFQVSDKNKKENIAKIENATKKINQISGYTYQFKLAPAEIKKGDKPIQSSGVLAQEVEKILPQAIQKNEFGDYFVDYAAITPLLIEAIKEQNAKIKLLETINIEILKRLEKLENK